MCDAYFQIINHMYPGILINYFIYLPQVYKLAGYPVIYV